MSILDPSEYIGKYALYFSSKYSLNTVSLFIFVPLSISIYPFMFVQGGTGVTTGDGNLLVGGILSMVAQFNDLALNELGGVSCLEQIPILRFFAVI